MIEFYKVVGEYQADVRHVRTGEVYDVRAKILEGSVQGRYHIRYSHTYRPTESAAGMYYSNSFTGADTLEGAEQLVRGWFEQIADSYEVGTWSDDL